MKIANVLNLYFETKLNLSSKNVNGHHQVIGNTKNIEKMKNIRNGLVHDGSLSVRSVKMRRKKAIRHMSFFIRLTEQLIVKTFELEPSEVFNTSDRLTKWTRGKL